MEDFIFTWLRLILFCVAVFLSIRVAWFLLESHTADSEEEAHYADGKAANGLYLLLVVAIALGSLTVAAKFRQSDDEPTPYHAVPPPPEVDRSVTNSGYENDQ